MADIEVNDDPFRLYDTKERAFVNQKEYKSRQSATRVAEKRNQEYGAHRYSAEKYSDIVRRNTPTSSGGRASTGPSGAGLLHEMNPQKLYAKGGSVSSASSRGDGCAVRGKTKGRMV
jgi:hypothetical protein